MSLKAMAKALLLLAVMAVPVAARDGASEAKRKLDSTRVSVDFKSAPLGDVIAFLREQTDLNFYLAHEDADAGVTMKLKDVSARTVLKYALDPHGLTAAWREGVIVIESVSRTGARMVTRVYDVRGQGFPLEDHPGLDLELSTEGIGVQSITLGGPEGSFVDPVLTVDYIQRFTGKGPWDRDSGASITHSNGLLIVKQTPAVHREIHRLLGKLELYP